MKFKIPDLAQVEAEMIRRGIPFDRKIQIPSLAAVESEMIRRGIMLDDEKAIPTGGNSNLPPVIAAADRLEGTFRRVWTTAMREIAKAVPVAELARAMHSGRADTVFGQFIRPEMKKKAGPSTSATMRAAWLKGAWVGADQLKPLGIHMRAARPVVIRFDLVNAQAVSWAAENSGRLIQDVTDDQILAVSTFISESIQNGRTVDQTAQDIKKLIGLREDQVITLQGYRDELTAQGLDEAVIDTQFVKRAEEMLASRATQIARTEVVSAANAGQQDLWDMAASQGLIDKNTTYKVWIATPDNLECADCLDLDGTSVLLDEQFKSDLGNVDGPTLHTNCRCGLNLKFEKG